MDIRRFIYLFILVFSFVSCKTSTYYKMKDDTYYVKLLIRGPGSCSHMLLLNQNGKGKIIRGRTLDSHAKEFKSFYDVEFLSYFEVDSKEKMNEINNIIETISKSELTKNSYLLDARRKEMFVDGDKKFDVYGWKGDKLIEFLEKLSRYLPYDINSFCTTNSGILVKN